MNALHRLAPLATAAAAATAATAATVGLAVLAPVSGAAAAASAGRPGSDHGHSRTVGWNGWRGIRFGDSIRAVHGRVGGVYVRGSGAHGSCGDVLSLPSATVDAKVGPRPHRVGDIEVSSDQDRVSFPLGISTLVRAGVAERRLHRHGFTVHTVRRHDSDGYPLDESTSVGPHGHTLWFVSDVRSHEIYGVGLSLDRRVALGELRNPAC